MPPPPHAQVAQLVEQRTENPRVGGSIPPLGTISPSQANAASLKNSIKSHNYRLRPSPKVSQNRCQAQKFVGINVGIFSQMLVY